MTPSTDEQERDERQAGDQRHDDGRDERLLDHDLQVPEPVLEEGDADRAGTPSPTATTKT